jgi:hypothetical protein
VSAFGCAVALLVMRKTIANLAQSRSRLRAHSDL